MTEIKITNDKDSADEDWAILPFDEAEDDGRWERISAEIDGLEKNVSVHEASRGTILMEENFSGFQPGEETLSENKGAETVEDEPF
jgi:hypothetical protein